MRVLRGAFVYASRSYARLFQTSSAGPSSASVLYRILAQVVCYFLLCCSGCYISLDTRSLPGLWVASPSTQIPKVCEVILQTLLSSSSYTEYLSFLVHSTALCDRCLERIHGAWFRCAYCAKDLCADCEAVDTHDETHLFVVFKAPVRFASCSH